jgi:hypothetical protein
MRNSIIQYKYNDQIVSILMFLIIIISSKNTLENNNIWVIVIDTTLKCLLKCASACNFLWNAKWKKIDNSKEIDMLQHMC